MKKVSTKKKIENLTVKNAPDVVGGQAKLSDSARPTESLSLNFTKIEYKY